MLPESGRLGKRLERKSEKNGSQAEDSLEVEPLVSRVRGMVLRVCSGVSTRSLTCLGVDLSKPEWCFVLAADYSSSSPAIKKMGSVTGAVTTRPTPSAVLAERVKGASAATAVSVLRG